jgi:heptaprenyl diphosphate synthase
MYSLGIKEAFLLSVMRVTISGFMFGNVIAIAYSLAGGLLSLLVMFLLKKTDKLSCISVSIAGGIFHNIGQMIIATILVDNYYVLYYVPVLMVAGFITGACIGVVAQEVFLRIGKQMRVK